MENSESLILETLRLSEQTIPRPAKLAKLAIEVARLSEFDYLGNRFIKRRISARAFLFGRKDLFPCLCDLFKIELNIARLLLISWRINSKIGDPVFSFLNNEDTDNIHIPDLTDIREMLETKEC